MINIFIVKLKYLNCAIIKLKVVILMVDLKEAKSRPAKILVLISELYY
jgi:hypothetical protein